MKRNILMVGVLALLVLALALFTDIQSVEDYYLTHMEDITPDSETVTISIRCDTVLDNWNKLDEQLRDEKYIPSDGVILPETTYVLRPGDTAFDVLQRACQYNQIQMEYQGAELSVYNSIYIKGIHYLYEFSCGELSGWMFRINGDYATRGCDSITLQDGDKVEWIYTCDLGRDIGDIYMGGES
ncbi:DUF4430 domain-containing protein [Lachnospiraceae bacterium LCP19S3_B12]